MHYIIMEFLNGMSVRFAAMMLYFTQISPFAILRP